MKTPVVRESALIAPVSGIRAGLKRLLHIGWVANKWHKSMKCSEANILIKTGQSANLQEKHGKTNLHKSFNRTPPFTHTQVGTEMASFTSSRKRWDSYSSSEKTEQQLPSDWQYFVIGCLLFLQFESRCCKRRTRCIHHCDWWMQFLRCGGSKIKGWYFLSVLSYWSSFGNWKIASCM